METPVHIIGLVVPDLLDTHFAEVARGVAGVMRPKGYMVLVSNSEGDASAETQAIELMLACRQVDGLILASCRAPDDVGIFERIGRHKLPYVLIDRTFPGLEASFVGADDEKIGAAATEHLIGRGCRHIAHIRGPETSCGLGRFHGYCAALVRHNLKVCPGYVAPGGSSDAAGYEAMRRLLAVTPRLDGVVCYNDAVAVGAIKAILESGLEIPYDIEVVGAGNVHYSDILRVPLSTIDLNSSTIGRRAAELLLDMLEANKPRPPQTVLVPFELVARESSKATCV